MGLAGEDELNRPVRISEDTRQAVGISQEQRGSLVGDEPPDKADGERSWIQKTSRGYEELFSGTAAGKLLSLVIAGVLDEPGPCTTSRIPKRFVLGAYELAPGFWGPR